MEEEKTLAKKRPPPIYEISPKKIGYFLAFHFTSYSIAWECSNLFKNTIPFTVLLCVYVAIFCFIQSYYPFINASNFYHPELLSADESQRMRSMHYKVEGIYARLDWAIDNNNEKYKKTYEEISAMCSAQLNLQRVCWIKTILGTEVPLNPFYDEKSFKLASQNVTKKLDHYVQLFNHFMTQYNAEFNPEIVSIRDEITASNFKTSKESVTSVAELSNELKKGSKIHQILGPNESAKFAEPEKSRSTYDNTVKMFKNLQNQIYDIKTENAKMKEAFQIILESKNVA